MHTVHPQSTMRHQHRRCSCHHLHSNGSPCRGKAMAVSTNEQRAAVPFTGDGQRQRRSAERLLGQQLCIEPRYRIIQFNMAKPSTARCNIDAQGSREKRRRSREIADDNWAETISDKHQRLHTQTLGGAPGLCSSSMHFRCECWFCAAAALLWPAPAEQRGGELSTVHLRRRTHMRCTKLKPPRHNLHSGVF